MQNDEHSERLWAYVHGELSPEAHAELEAALADDPELREAHDAVSHLHGTLNRAGPLLETSRDDLVEEALAAFDADTEAAEAASTPVSVPSQPPSRPFVLNPFARIGLAMAAGLVLFIGVTRGMGSGPLMWDDVAVRTASYRGAPEVPPVTMTPQAAREMILEFRRHVDSFYEATRPKAPRREWRLHVNVIALHDGAFTLELMAHLRRDPDVRVDWDESFVGAAAFAAAAESHARDVADALSAAVE